MALKIISSEDLPMKIPEQIATCPICHLQAEITEIVECDDDGKVLDLHLSCISEPDIDDKSWNNWMNGHFSMPYVDWLPVEIKVIEWFNQHYLYGDKYDDQRKLAAWNAAVKR